MYAVSYRNTMANARPKIAPPVEVPAVEAPELPRLTWAQKVNAAWEERQRAQREYEELVALVLARAAEEQGTPVERVTVKSIIRMVADKHGLSVDAILSQRRDRLTVAARHEAIVTAATLREDLSLPALGRQFKRDHTTILHALRKAGVRRAAR